MWDKLVGFDVESTGVSVETDEILTASIVHVAPGQPVRSATEWLRPTRTIPPGATKIHGITDAIAAQKGDDPRKTLDAICMVLELVIEEQTPIVGMNVPYDFTILDRNCRRHGVKTLGDRLGGDDKIRPIVCILVLDKVLVPRRKGAGARKLGALCEYYRVPSEGQHDSAADALMALRVFARMRALSSELAQADPGALHDAQVAWKAKQDLDLAAYFRSQGKDAQANSCDGLWPIKPLGAV